MNALKKLIGFFILLFFALPILFGIIWAVGLAQAFVSPGVIKELPERINRSLPQIADEAMASAERDDTRWSPPARAWLRAVKEAGIPPREVLEKSGVMAWVRDDLGGTLQRIDEVLRGKRHPEDVVLNLRPLKKACSSDAAGQFFLAVVDKLPACTPETIQQWKEAIAWEGEVDWERLPPCRPGPEVAKNILELTRGHLQHEIPDEVDIFQFDDDDDFPRHFNFASFTLTFSYLLFLIPAGFILVGTLLIARNRGEFFRWAGAFILIGGLLVLGTVYLTHHVSDWVIDGFPFNFWHHMSWAEEYLAVHLGSHFQEWVQPFVSPVKEVAEVVAIVGLIIFALSFVMDTRRRRESEATETPPPPASSSPGQG